MLEPSTAQRNQSGKERLWSVNPDNNSVTVLDTVTRSKLAEIPVGDHPSSISLASDGYIWVNNKDSATLSQIDPQTLQVAQIFLLPPASQPAAVLAHPHRARLYVTLEATGELLELDSHSGTVYQRLAIGSDPRHLALDMNNQRLYVSRFITPPVPGESTKIPQVAQQGGELLEIDLDYWRVQSTIVLQHSSANDTEHSARGIPNYLGAAALSPDGLYAWVPSKQDNILRGIFRDGLDLNHDNTVRAITSLIVRKTATENYSARLDHNDSSLASSAIFDQHSSYLFIALESSQEVAVLDAYGHEELTRFSVERAPQGLALSEDGKTLYVHNFMSRSVTAHDLRGLIEQGRSGPGSIPQLHRYTLVAEERLSPQVLRGKQLFYDAKDPRLARESYMSCAVCHNDGGHDGRVWDLTGMGEGLRNTIDLRGHGMQHGILHWSGNFDEVQDFEGQIRSLAGGSGLMAEADFNRGTYKEPLGDAKAGLSEDLDALAAYVNSLTAVPQSPYRRLDGTLSEDAQAGKALFSAKGCEQCHSGAFFTDSQLVDLKRHNVGSVAIGSGLRLGQASNGVDTPSLLGLWLSAPYLHNGAALTVEEAIAAHTGIANTDVEQAQLAAYLLQLDTHAQ